MIERLTEIMRGIGEHTDPLSPEEIKKLQTKMNGVIESFHIGQGTNDKITQAVIFGRHRVGRIVNVLPKHHIPLKHPEFDYYYDIADLNIPHLRRGLIISDHRIKLYDTTQAESGEQIIYSEPKTPYEIQELIASFDSMPQFPGDLRTEG